MAVLDHEEHDRLGHGVGDGPIYVCMYICICMYVHIHIYIVGLNVAILTAVWQCLTMKSMTALGTALETGLCMYVYMYVYVFMYIHI